MIDMLDITTGKRDVRRYLSSSVILKTQVLLSKKSQSFPVDIKKNKLKWAGDLEGLKSFIFNSSAHFTVSNFEANEYENEKEADVSDVEIIDA